MRNSTVRWTLVAGIWVLVVALVAFQIMSS
jgi:hypothetical protein